MRRKSNNLVKKGAFKKLRKESVRKLFHLLGVPLVGLYLLSRYYFGEQVAMLVMTLTLIILLEMEYVRLEYKLKLPEPINVLRRHERTHITSSIFFVISAIICFGAFDFQIAVMALLMTVFGDMFSALAGISFGHHRAYKMKTWEGFAGGLMANLAVGFLMLPGQYEISVPMALTASLAELFTGKLDDNLTVPIASGFAAQALVFMFGINAHSFPGPAILWLLDAVRIFG